MKHDYKDAKTNESRAKSKILGTYSSLIDSAKGLTPKENITPKKSKINNANEVDYLAI